MIEGDTVKITGKTTGGCDLFIGDVGKVSDIVGETVQVYFELCGNRWFPKSNVEVKNESNKARV